MKVSQPPVTGEVSTARVQLYLCVPLYALNNSIECTQLHTVTVYDVALYTHKSTMTMWQDSTRSCPKIKAISQWTLSRCVCFAILCGNLSVLGVSWNEFCG